MANGFALELQKGLRAALVADSDVTALVSTRIYDEPPQAVTYPFVRFGDIVPRAADTDGRLGMEITLSFHAFSRTTGRVQAAQIAEAIRESLHRKETTVSLTGFNLIELLCDTYFVDQDNEGRGHEAKIVFSAILEAA
jgi:hypothetical protein